jgi:type IV secretory pathway TrbD component
VLRIQTLCGAERDPAFIGFGCAAMMGFIALYGQLKALYGLPVCVLWHCIWMYAYKIDPQYWQIMWRKFWWYPWPSQLSPAPGVIAREVRIEASVPVRE